MNVREFDLPLVRGGRVIGGSISHTGPLIAGVECLSCTAGALRTVRTNPTRTVTPPTVKAPSSSGEGSTRTGPDFPRKPMVLTTTGCPAGGQDHRGRSLSLALTCRGCLAHPGICLSDHDGVTLLLLILLVVVAGDDVPDRGTVRWEVWLARRIGRGRSTARSCCRTGGTGGNVNGLSIYQHGSYYMI